MGLTLVLAQVVVHNSIARAAAHVAKLQEDECVNSRFEASYFMLGVFCAVTELGVTNVDGRVQRSRFDSRERNQSGDRCAT
jgi:hypothetical protein